MAEESNAKRQKEMEKRIMESMEPVLKMGEELSSYWSRSLDMRYLEPIRESMRSFCAISEKMNEAISASIEPLRKNAKLIASTMSNVSFLGNITSTQINLVSGASLVIPSVKPIKPVEIPKENQDKLDKLLEDFDPTLKAKRNGAWTTFNSDNPDRLSQSANSMIELIVHVRRKIEKQHGNLKTYLENKYGSDRMGKFGMAELGILISEWIETTIKTIEKIKSQLEEAKHKVGYDDEIRVEAFLRFADGFLLILLG